MANPGSRSEDPFMAARRAEPGMPNRLTLVMLALGTFAIGTDGFIVSGVLPMVGDSLSVSTATAGQLLTLFTIVYAVAAPVLAALTSRIERRTLLTTAMAVFVFANLLGAAAPAYWVIVIARVLSALGAAVYVGPAVAVAASVVPAEYRARAYSVVVSGVSVATALGLPLGTLIGTLTSWRITLASVAGIALVATVGLVLALPPLPRLPAVSLAERLRVSARPRVLGALGANLFVAAGAYGLFVYIAPLTYTATPLRGAGLTVVLLAWGLAAMVANPLGGRWSDGYGANRVFLVGVVAVAAVLLAFGFLVALAPASSPVTAVLFVAATAALSVACWGLQPAQASRLIDLAPQAPAVVVSFGNSASYVGISLGGATGGLVLSRWSVTTLGWMATAFALLAVAFAAAAVRRRPADRPRDATRASTAVAPARQLKEDRHAE